MVVLHSIAGNSALAASARPEEPSEPYFVQYQTPAPASLVDAMVPRNGPAARCVVNTADGLAPPPGSNLASTVDRFGNRDLFYVAGGQVVNRLQAANGVWGPGRFDGADIPAAANSHLCATTGQHDLHLFVQVNANITRYTVPLAGGLAVAAAVPADNVAAGTALAATTAGGFVHLFYRTNNDPARIRKIVWFGNETAQEDIPDTADVVAGSGLAAVSFRDEWRLYYHSQYEAFRNIVEVGGENPFSINTPVEEGLGLQIAAVVLDPAPADPDIAAGFIRHILFKGPSGAGGGVVVRRVVTTGGDGGWGPVHDLAGQ